MRKIWTLFVGLFKGKTITSSTPVKEESQNQPIVSVAEENPESPNGDFAMPSPVGYPQPFEQPQKNKASRKSQRQMVINELLQSGTVSVKKMRSVGVTRTVRIISELRKEGWHIKTKVLMKNGDKRDIHYSLQEEPNLPVA